MRLTIPLLAVSLASLVLADFFISNTSVCMGAFFVQSCTYGVQVLSETQDLSGKQNSTDYKCGYLLGAQDSNYIHNGTMGDWGSPYVSSEGGICGSSQLRFIQTVDTNGTQGYQVHDKDDKHVGDCKPDNMTVSRNCDQWVGSLFFASSYKCTSSVCD